MRDPQVKKYNSKEHSQILKSTLKLRLIRSQKTQGKGMMINQTYLIANQKISGMSWNKEEIRYPISEKGNIQFALNQRLEQSRI